MWFQPVFPSRGSSDGEDARVVRGFRKVDSEAKADALDAKRSREIAAALRVVRFKTKLLDNLEADSRAFIVCIASTRIVAFFVAVT